MIDQFKKILDSLSAKGGTPVALLAILKMDEVEDRWTVIFSNESTLTTDIERNTIFSMLLEELKKVLTPSELAQIARVGVLSIEEHLVQSLLPYRTGTKLLNEKVNGNFVHEGYIIKSTTDALSDKNSLPSDYDSIKGERVPPENTKG